MNVITKTVELPDGRTISIETGKLAKQADGAVMLRMNNTMLLATVCAAKDAVPGTDFMPLQVEYREKYFAAGRFPGGFTKREGKANDDEILTCRLVDRALRPLFPSDYHAEVYVNVILFSADGEDMPDALAGFAASAALAVSDIPFEGPISEVRVARINGEFVINPTFAQLKNADMDLMVGATEENIMMVEGEMKEVQESDLLAALKAAHEAIKPMCRLQKELSKELGKDVKREYCHEVNDDELREAVKAAVVLGDVHQQTFLVIWTERVPMVGTTQGGGKLRLHVVPLQEYTVVARVRLFLGVREPRAVVIGIEAAGDRQHGDMQLIPVSLGAMSERVYLMVFVLVSATTAVHGHRCALHHGVWHGSPGKCLRTPCTFCLCACVP